MLKRPAADLLRLHQHTVADYHRMGDVGILKHGERVELIEGVIVDRAPIGSPHAGIVKRLIQVLARAVGDRAIVSVQNPVVLGDFSEPEPDLMLLRPSPDFYAAAHPTAADVLLLIEVADTSLRYDREIKIPLYARHGIPEVWLIDVESKKIAIYTQPSGERYSQANAPVDMRRTPTPGVAGAQVDLSVLFGSDGA